MVNAGQRKVASIKSFLDSLAMRSTAYVTTRPRYGGRGPRLMRTLAEQPVPGASICILNPADPDACACRNRNAAWPTDCELGQAA